jgi:hypothetical protein
MLAPMLQDWTHLLTDPDRKELGRMLRVGESVAWPKVRAKEPRPAESLLILLA